WESRLATDRSQLIEAHARVHIAYVELNRILDRGEEDLYETVPPSLVDPDLITGFGRLNQYVDNAAAFTLFKEFMVREGFGNSPELHAIDAAIAARERAALAARRSYWAPDLSLFADLEQRIHRSGAGSTVVPGLPVQTDASIWAVSLVASLPLYAGGARKADVRQTTEELAGLRLRRVDVAQRVEQRIRIALYRISSTFPAIELAREAAAASKRNLELVTDSYARGLVSIIDLLDAQNSALVTEEFAANAEYDFLIDLMDLQRATSRFDFFESSAGRDAWFDRLEAYFEENAERIRWPAR
ncbi:MAG: TolC family protein, partial [Acidobacteriota bacterium]|nr:TolC family protein [Acidobacteriota bacterium]